MTRSFDRGDFLQMPGFVSPQHSFAIGIQHINRRIAHPRARRPGQGKFGGGNARWPGLLSYCESKFP